MADEEDRLSGRDKSRNYVTGNGTSILFVTALLILANTRFQSTGGYLVLGASVGLVAAFCLSPRFTERIARLADRNGNGWLVWTADRIRVMTQVVARCTRDPRTIAFAFGLTILVYFPYLAATRICLAAFGETVSLLDTALLTSMLVLSRTVNVIPGNLGISELITGLSSGVLMGNMFYGVMIAVIFRVVDYVVIGAAFLGCTCRDVVGRS